MERIPRGFIEFGLTRLNQLKAIRNITGISSKQKSPSMDSLLLTNLLVRELGTKLSAASNDAVWSSRFVLLLLEIISRVGLSRMCCKWASIL